MYRIGGARDGEMDFSMEGSVIWNATLPIPGRQTVCNEALDRHHIKLLDNSINAVLLQNVLPVLVKRENYLVACESGRVQGNRQENRSRKDIKLPRTID